MHIWLKCCKGIDRPCNHVPPARGVRTRRALVRLLPGVSSLVCREVVAARKHLERKQVQEQIMNIRKKTPREKASSRTNYEL